MTKIIKTNAISKGSNLILLGNAKSAYEKFGLSKEEADYVKKRFTDPEKKQAAINRLGTFIFVQQVEKKPEHYQTLEYSRRAGSSLAASINGNNIKEITIVDIENKSEETLALAEGMALANYQFLKYRKDADKKKNSLETIHINSKKISSRDIEILEIALDATFKARTLVNEPVNFLTAVQLSKEIEKMAKASGCKVEVFNKAKIQALKMGGLLSVNLGSIDPPTFSIMEWKPSNVKNKKPYVLVGKGVVYDTGGLSLKPTPNSMDQMKCDMAGAAAVSCAVYAIAKAKLPVHVIALVPATDNRPGENAYVPGDIITMYSGATVEMLNADAEGRMILADALEYAKRYDPQLVMDFATLTGAAAAAIGSFGTVTMGTADEKTKNKLKQSANNVYERLAEFPFWEEYDELIKSDIADMKNIGGPYGGAITAGKFLHHYTKYPWMHFDIAGPAFLMTKDNYRIKGGTGVGVRFLFDFFKSL